jgi:hypothetical protein
MEGLKPYQTSPKAPIPTGCKSVYLQIHHVTIKLSFYFRKQKGSIPAGDLKGRAKNLGTYEFGHFGSRASVTPAQ